jgi:hypothetical protein
MCVGTQLTGHIVVDDRLYSLDIQTTGGKIRCEQVVD